MTNKNQNCNQDNDGKTKCSCHTKTNIVVNNELEPVIVDISTPPMGYHLFNFQMAKTLEINSKTSAKFVLNVNNIFDQTYRDYLNRQRFFAEELGRNFLLQLQINY